MNAPTSNDASATEPSEALPLVNHFRTCPLCEATCGLEIAMRGGEVVRIRGDRNDVFSRGYLCPKGTALGHLDTDPDRVRRPLIKENGVFREATWDEAFALIADRLGPIRAKHGNDAVALYVGNPNAHSLAGAMYTGDVLRAFRSKNIFSASTVDQMPKQVSAGLMFGTIISIPVPDVDRCEYLVMLGANPYDSNGSLFTAPDLPGRLDAMRARGGRLVVVDPRRSKTADHADEHVAIRPGTDALWLFAIVHVLFEEGLVNLGHVGPLVSGLDVVERLSKSFSPESVAARCGVPASTTRRIARELAAASRACVYGRIGTCTQAFGTTASWLVDVVNVLTGNLDREGGAMFTTPAAGGPTTRGAGGKGRGVAFGRWSSRVGGHGEVFGELPVIALPEEIETPGEGQVRAMIVIGGNPVSSNPDSDRLDRAMASLEFMVSVDIYVNETSRHADVILPSNRTLTKSHFDVSLYQLATRNVANWSPAIQELDETVDERHEWETLLRLAAIGEGRGADIDVMAADDNKARDLCEKSVGAHQSFHGMTAEELFATVSTRCGPDRMLDLMLRSGPYGAPNDITPNGLTLDVLAKNPHGIDFGPLQRRVPDVLRTPSGLIDLAPTMLVDDVDRLLSTLANNVNADSVGSLELVGRRHVRSNNSWMHNIRTLVKGKNRCTMHINPTDATRWNIGDGEEVIVRSDVGEVIITAEVTDAVMAGVVSIPHGWGQKLDGVRLSTATSVRSVNTNVLIPPNVDPLSGTAVLNGVSVTVSSAKRHH